MKLRKIKIERFKRLDAVDFDVGGVNILVGGNNSGKSTIIQAAHFAFTLLQSLAIGNKWPAQQKKSSTISPNELIYIPSDDPYSLGYGGRLLEDSKKAIVIEFTFDSGEILPIAIRKGRITNLIVEPDNIEFAKSLSKLEAPFSVFSPGLAGVSRNENYVSDGVLLRALARGDANVVLRNILYRLHQKAEWDAFESDLALIFPLAKIEVQFDPTIDQFVSVTVVESGRRVPLDLAGTGLLQTVQILSYFHLFAPKLIILDEPDSHLHPNNQRLLCALLSSLSIDRDVQVLITTHSRHVLDTMYNDAKLLWVQDGKVATGSPEDQLDILLELGALDVKEKMAAKKFKAVVLTEDKITQLIAIVLRNSGFDLELTNILPYNGVTSVHLLKPLIKQIKDVSDAAIILHRDRDYLEDAEVEEWKKEITRAGAEPFVTSDIDVEGSFATPEYIKLTADPNGLNIDEICAEVVKNEQDDIIADYVNGRIDFARKAGTLGKLNIGKVGAEAAKRVATDPFALMKGKRRLAKLRRIFHEDHNMKYDVLNEAAIPIEPALEMLAKKIFPKKIS
jgi:ABC-type multidrug transport system ATPase subunit